MNECNFFKFILFLQKKYYFYLFLLSKKIMPISLKNTFNFLFLFQMHLKTNLKKKYYFKYNFFIIKIKKIIKKKNKKFFFNFFLKKPKEIILVKQFEKINKIFFLLVFQKINRFKKFKFKLKKKKINFWALNIKRKAVKIIKKKFKRVFRRIKKSKFYLKKISKKLKITKKSNLFIMFLILKPRPSVSISYKIKKKMSLFLNYHPQIKFVLKRTFKKIKIFNTKKLKTKLFYDNTGFRYAKYLKFEKYSEHMNVRFSKDIIIKRIKFKNNYIQIWKKARFVFKNFYNMSYKYQKQLTRKLFNYSKFCYNNFFINFFNFKNILQTVLNKMLNVSVQWLIKSGFVFLNGNNCPNENKILVLNDKIALAAHKLFYKFFYFFSVNIFEKKKKIFKWFIYIFKRVKFNVFKSKKTHLSKKYLTYFNLKRDIPNFIEFDFITLTGFVLYSDLLLKNIIKHEYTKFNLYIYRNYNWKFIT